MQYLSKVYFRAIFRTCVIARTYLRDYKAPKNLATECKQSQPLSFRAEQRSREIWIRCVINLTGMKIPIINHSSILVLSRVEGILNHFPWVAASKPKALGMLI